MRRLVLTSAALIPLASLLAGCVNADARFADSAGHYGQCNAVAFGVISSIVSEAAYRNCKDFYHSHGYSEVAD
jgi:hypothetical protein